MGEVGLGALSCCVVQLAEVTKDQPVRPRVGDDVMREEQQYVVVVGDASERDTKARLPREIKGRIRDSPQRSDRHGLSLLRRLGTHVVNGNRNRSSRLYYLLGPVAVCAKHSTQGLVS